jgi:ABC-type nitrate/sulfonate/bicarbonate transport system substrate-binding protein
MEETMRKLLSIAALAMLGSLGIAPATRADPTLTVGKADANASPLIPANVGEKLGIFKKHGLDVKVVDFSGGSKTIQAMTAGSVDIGLSAGPELALVAKGAPVLGVCDAVPPIPFIGIAVPWDSSIRDVAGLKGKKIGISSAGSLTDWLARELARHEGWPPDSVTTVAIGNGITSVIAGFRAHTVDAAVAVTSNIFSMEENKEGRLLIPVSSYVGNLAAGTIYATNSLIASDPDAIRKFLAAWLETVAFIRTHKTEAVKLESAVTGFSESVQTKEYDLTVDMFSKNCRFDAESLATLKRSFADMKLLSTPPDMSKLYTEAFLPK